MQPEQFAITYQDTDAGPYDGGSSGSQTTFNNGRAVVEAAREVRRQLLELAAGELEASVDDLELADGARRRRRQPGPAADDRRARLDRPRRGAPPGPRQRQSAGRAATATCPAASAGSGSSRSPPRPTSATPRG